MTKIADGYILTTLNINMLTIKQHQYQSIEYGSFIFEELSNKCTVWWDPEEVGDGFSINNYLYDSCFDISISNSRNLSVKDFSDLPNNGEFRTFNEAYDYIVLKFGKIT